MWISRDTKSEDWIPGVVAEEAGEEDNVVQVALEKDEYDDAPFEEVHFNRSRCRRQQVTFGLFSKLLP